MTPATLTDVLEDLLTKAEQSHLAHQQEHGETEWPQYYAEYLHRALGEEYTLEQVSTALREAVTAHGVYEEENGGTRDEQWPRWYAEHMSGSLSREWYQWAAELDAWEG